MKQRILLCTIVIVDIYSVFFLIIFFLLNFRDFSFGKNIWMSILHVQKVIERPRNGQIINERWLSYCSICIHYLMLPLNYERVVGITLSVMVSRVKVSKLVYALLRIFDTFSIKYATLYGFPSVNIGFVFFQN